MTKSIQKVEKEFLGHKFIYETLVDESTGQALWNNKIDKKFSKWLHELKNKDRELFRVQYPISSNAYKVLNHIKELVGAYDDSLLVRAITITFINHLDTHKGRPIMKKLAEYKKPKDIENLKKGEVLQKSLYFSPSGIRAIESYSKITGLKKSQAVQNALYSVLLISINEDDEIKRYWEEVILSQLETIAKAA
ncbi:MAG: hypothetical protein ACOVP4_13880 [Bacteriovoracaceae bacterium]